MQTLTTRVFMKGNSQAIRIPVEFRFNTDRVQISRSKQGDLVIQPLPVERGAALLETLEGFDDEFIAALEDDQQEQLPMQDRERIGWFDIPAAGFVRVADHY